MEGNIECPRCGAKYPQTEVMPDGSLFCHREGVIVLDAGGQLVASATSVPVVPTTVDSLGQPMQAVGGPLLGLRRSASVDTSATAPVMVSTTFDIPGYETVDFHGEIFGLIVRSRNVFSNLGASAKALVGGELRGLTKLLANGRRDAIERLRWEARQHGANAVIGLRYDASEIGDSATEIVAYGTAVTVARPSDPNQRQA